MNYSQDLRIGIIIDLILIPYVNNILSALKGIIASTIVIIMFIFSFILSLFANHLPVMYVQVPQWADDWAVCAVDIPDAKCHWYVVAPDNTFGEGFDWEEAPWFDVNGLNDVAPMQAKTVVEKLQEQQ